MAHVFAEIINYAKSDFMLFLMLDAAAGDAKHICKRSENDQLSCCCAMFPVAATQLWFMYNRGTVMAV
jgi:hypothetical protein